MKLTKLKYCAAFAVVAFATGLTAEANAQLNWNQGNSPSCSDRGGCQYGIDSVELNPSGQSNGYGNRMASTRIPYRGSFRAPYQISCGDYSVGCEYGGERNRSLQFQASQHFHGSSNSNSAGRCPNQQQQFELASFAPQSTYGNQRRYVGKFEDNSGINTLPSYAAPRRRNLESHQQTPADRRPELRTSPSFVPSDSYGQNEPPPQSRELTVPPTSTKIMPPPELPPQPSAAIPRQSMPQLLPPTAVPSSQESPHDHAGHDHSGHDHSGHNH